VDRPAAGVIAERTVRRVADATRLTVFANQFEAELLRSALGSEGIESYSQLTDIAAASFGVPGFGGGPVAVWVSKDDLDRAREVLARIDTTKT
jgi:hypothetical protein